MGRSASISTSSTRRNSVSRVRRRARRRGYLPGRERRGAARADPEDQGRRLIVPTVELVDDEDHGVVRVNAHGADAHRDRPEGREPGSRRFVKTHMVAEKKARSRPARGLRGDRVRPLRARGGSPARDRQAPLRGRPRRSPRPGAPGRTRRLRLHGRRERPFAPARRGCARRAARSARWRPRSTASSAPAGPPRRTR